MPELLTVEDLRVEYLREGGDLCVVDGVSFGIGPGEVFGLAGESGSGKSTIALSLVRLLRAPGVITGGHLPGLLHDWRMIPAFHRTIGTPASIGPIHPTAGRGAPNDVLKLSRTV